MGLKPMNCPGHCLIFSHMAPSYRDLPIKLADFSPLHRNEASGALKGLTRLRRFCQDDAHIFTSTEHIQTVIAECLEFIKDVYTTLKFNYRFVFCRSTSRFDALNSVVLSTRPKSFLGSIEVWDLAEKALKDTLTNLSMPFTINEGDGAFYGPKIDVLVKDALQREHQCGTIQLDFQVIFRRLSQPPNFPL